MAQYIISSPASGILRVASGITPPLTPLWHWSAGRIVAAMRAAGLAEEQVAEILGSLIWQAERGSNVKGRSHERE